MPCLVLLLWVLGRPATNWWLTQRRRRCCSVVTPLPLLLLMRGAHQHRGLRRPPLRRSDRVLLRQLAVHECVDPPPLRRRLLALPHRRQQRGLAQKASPAAAATAKQFIVLIYGGVNTLNESRAVCGGC